jgi:hypothetical protein
MVVVVHVALDAKRLAKLVELVISRWLARARGEQPIAERLAVVGEDVMNLERERPGDELQKLARGGRGFVGFDGDDDLARGAVDGNKQIAPRGLVEHLRQAFAVDMDVTDLVVLVQNSKPSGKQRLEPESDPSPTPLQLRRCYRGYALENDNSTGGSTSL